MKREDEIRNKAYELGQKYFPDECNIWARANIEAQYVSSACTEMAEWMQKKMIEKACEWLWEYYPTLERAKSFEDAWEHFKKALEE